MSVVHLMSNVCGAGAAEFPVRDELEAQLTVAMGTSDASSKSIEQWEASNKGKLAGPKGAEEVAKAPKKTPVVCLCSHPPSLLITPSYILVHPHTPFCSLTARAVDH